MGYILFLIILVFLLIVFAISRIEAEKTISNKEIGEDGEELVRRVLGESVDGEKQVFNDYKFISNGKSVQIDHIFINKNGIFVIETKNYKGVYIWKRRTA